MSVDTLTGQVVPMEHKPTDVISSVGITDSNNIRNEQRAKEKPETEFSSLDL